MVEWTSKLSRAVGEEENGAGRLKMASKLTQSSLLGLLPTFRVEFLSSNDNHSRTKDDESFLIYHTHTILGRSRL